MSLAEIEAELGKLTPEELRQLALNSWTAFVEKESRPDGAIECSEDDPDLLTALDEAIERADATPQQGCSASEVRSRHDALLADPVGGTARAIPGHPKPV